MSETLDERPTSSLAEALTALVARGTISQDQRAAILAEVRGAPALADGATPAPVARTRRRLADVLIEVGLYVGSALVLAAAVVIVAQRWQDLSSTGQVALLGGVALVTAAAGSLVSRGAADGSARRRLAGVILVLTAGSAAGAVGLAMGDSDASGTVALGVAVAVMVAAQVLARSAITEIGLFVASFALLNVAAEWVRPQPGAQFDEFGNEVAQRTAFDQLMPLGSVVYGAFWALLVARRLMHRELAVALGMGVAVVGGLNLAGDAEVRTLGLVALAVLAALGFWRFMADGAWPWLAAAVASVTACVFWLVGGDQQPALAILAAGLVLLGSSAVGWEVARHRRRRVDASIASP